MNTKVIAFAIILGVVGSASAASITFSGQTKNTTATKYVDALGNPISVNDTVTISKVFSGIGIAPGVVTISSLTYSYGAGGVDPLTTTSFTNGTGVLTLNSSTLGAATIKLTFNGTYAFKKAGVALFSESMSNGTPSSPLAVSLVGTGWLKNYAGTGTISNTLLVGSKMDRTSFSGTLQSVPEPATMAAMAIGGLGLLRRRRKA